MEYGKWFVSDDGETFKGSGWSTREAAISAAPSELGLGPGDAFWTGMAVRPADRISADDFIDMLDQHAMDDGVEGNDGYCVTAEAKADLAAFLADWEKKHDVRPLWFDILDEEEHVVQGTRTPSAEASPS